MSPAWPPQGLGRGKAKSVGQEAGRACRVEDRALNSGHVVLLCQPHDQHVTLGEWSSGLFSQKLGVMPLPMALAPVGVHFPNTGNWEEMGVWKEHP